jgi:hypothetical protein
MTAITGHESGRGAPRIKQYDSTGRQNETGTGTQNIFGNTIFIPTAAQQ